MNLPELMADLYGEEADARAVVRSAGVDTIQIDWHGSAVRVWGSILEEAAKTDRLDAVVGIACIRFPLRKAALAQALEHYVAAPQRVDPIGRLTPFGWCLLASRKHLDKYFPGIHRHLMGVPPFAEPPEFGAVNELLRGMRARLKQQLYDKVYEPLQALELPAPRPATPDSSRDPFVSPVKQVIVLLLGSDKGGGDSANAEIAAVNRRNRNVRNILTALKCSSNPLVLLGEPGSGKTLTLQYAVLAMIEEEVRRVFPRVPVFVRLGEFHVDGRAPDSTDVLNYVKQRAGMDPQLFDTLERSGRLAVFFDGMDEMSREAYNEHTEALSMYAGATASKAIFSCRVTDFSPRFIHQRLVLLAFNESQVAAFLDKYVTIFPVEIDGRKWSKKEFTQHVLFGDLPVEATNPFVLSLLCFYVGKEKAWPVSRVKLLEYFIARTYARKRTERKEGIADFPELDAALDAWGALAYQITQNNRGSIIPVAKAFLGSAFIDIHEALRVGKLCSVLVESQDGSDEHLVRFEHHRLQEYFTAVHINKAKIRVPWLDKIDVPRWQETLINVSLMDDDSTASAAMIEALDQGSARFLESLDGVVKATEKDKPLSEPLIKALAHRDALELSLADRVEVVSRALVQTKSPSRATLLLQFRASVEMLAEKGNPITQVKMMKVCQKVPELDFIAALQKPLNSDIGWVRDQALVLIGSSQSSSRALGADLVSEIGYDLARGTFLKRAGAYERAVRSKRVGGHLFALALGALNFMVYGAAIIGMAVASFALAAAVGDLAVPIDFPDFTILRHPVAMVLLPLALFAAMYKGHKDGGSHTWLMVPSFAMGTALLLPAGVSLWSGRWLPTFNLLVAIPCGVLAIVFLWVLVVGLVHFSAITAYLTLTRKKRHSDVRSRSFYATALASCSYRSALLWSLGFVAVGAIAWTLFYYVRFKWQNKEFSFIGVVFGGGLVISWIVGGIGKVIEFVGKAVEEFRTAGFLKGLLGGIGMLLGGLFGLLLGIAMLVVGVAGIEWVWGKLSLASLFETLNPKRALDSFGRYIAAQELLNQVLVVCIGVVLLVLLMKLMPRINIFRPASKRLTRDGFIDSLNAQNSLQQEALLSRVNHQLLSISPAEFLTLIQSVSPIIKKGPAENAYWHLRKKLEDAARHERAG